MLRQKLPVVLHVSVLFLLIVINHCSRLLIKMSWVVRIQGLKRDGSEPGVSRRTVDDDHRRQALRNAKLDSLLFFGLLDPVFSKTRSALLMFFGVPIMLRVYFMFFKRNRHLMPFVIGGSMIGFGVHYANCKRNDLEQFIRRDTVVANSIRDILREDMIDRKLWADQSHITKQIIVNRAFALEYNPSKQNELPQDEQPSKFLPKQKA